MAHKLKPTALAVLAATMVAGLLSGCADNTNNNKPEANQTNSADATNQANESNGTKSENVAAEPVEISWGIHFQANAVVENSPVQQWLEKKFNVKIKPVKVTDASIASGEVPDLFMLGDPANVSAYQSQGVLMDIDPTMLKEKMPEYAKDVESANALFQTVTFDDKLWAIPMFIDLKPYDLAMLYRKDWLDKVGITKIPETLDEFEKAAYAFAKNDPDGNGKQDTYGLTGTATSTWSTGFYSIFGAFGIEPTMWQEQNGQLVNGSIRNEAKDAVAKLAQWYKDGVIDPEFITDTQDSYRKKLYNGRIGTIEEQIGKAALEDGATITGMKAINPEAQLVLGKNPQGPGGSGSWDWGTKSNFVVLGRQVKEDPEKLAKIFEILNAESNDEETINMTSMGEKGKHWDFAESGATTGATKFLPEFEKQEQRDALGIRLFSLGNITTRAYREKYSNPKLNDVVRSFSTSPSWTDSLLFAALPSDGKYKQELTALTQKYFAQFISGEIPLTDWDKYVAEWKAKGGDELTKEANDLYVKQFKQ
ncbi:putative aldouronate transport system substrate-binding protein [Paenibacillus phyllosphaerae]|uniref:Putative aldouronate transport system substrate-binding protein n=1 Tax=Paenibacillus phyllosphaerae TaxID=274593 RepID=A0A7W5B2M7_9BACL|nr:extracellular solute-binding protein [Paenibacillus phyllosphaerae]MBB3113298.1 putative aldouronate transport system substrate-binding protein [Paenibacillus phyllosphaerae]